MPTETCTLHLLTSTESFWTNKEVGYIMKIINTEEKRNALAASTYSRFKNWCDSNLLTAKHYKQLEALEALGSHPKPEDVNTIIGDCLWTITPKCDQCYRNHENIIAFNDERFFLCYDCLQKAIVILGTHISNNEIPK